jgi:hypothetical protein
MPTSPEQRVTTRKRKRKRKREFLGLLKALRAQPARGKPYAVLDSFSPHGHAEARPWTVGNDIERVFLPADDSWLNRTETEAAALRYSALDGADHRGHGEQNAAIAACVRRRNARAEPRTDFAPGSPVRQWTGIPFQGRPSGATS